MTITLRIQYKGDAARKLAADEQNPAQSDPPKYIVDMKRALGIFQIPLPENSRPIWKSGFILCNWNITRDSTLFDTIYRGANRAESVACKSTLEGLSISYMQLFENSKRIYLPSKNRSISSDEAGFLQETQSVPPTHNNHKPYIHRSLQADCSTSTVSNASTAPQKQNSMFSRSQNMSARTIEDVKPLTGPSNGTRETSSQEGTGQVTQDTLRKLAESRSLLALLTQRLENNLPEPAVKQEVLSPTRLAPLNKLRDIPISAERPSSRDDRLLPAKAPFRTISPEERKSMDLVRRLEPPPESTLRARIFSGRLPAFEDDRLREHPAHQTGFRHIKRSLSPRGRSTEAHPIGKPPHEPHRDFRDDHRFSVNQDHNGLVAGHGYKRHSFNSEKPFVPDSPWNSGVKRPLSPAPPGRQGRSTSPPLKRRWDAKLRVPAADPRPRRSVSPAYNKASRFQARAPPVVTRAQDIPSSAESNTNAVASTSAPTGARHPQAHALNRELWDVRRQITALKAREDIIMNELKTARAPELPENVVVPEQPSLEDRVKIMAAEIHALRERLQRETARRQLVEEACENERRRRKLAEDILDDTRRESSAPLMLPAMMDAFEKIAQLTGDALSPIEVEDRKRS